MKFQYEKRVTFEDVDLNYQLRIDVLAGLLQQVAALHSQNLGWGEEEVKALGMTWVLNTLKIEIISNPVKEDQLTIFTWSRKVEGFKGLREFRVYRNNELLISASSVWLTIDFNKRKIARGPDSLMNAYPEVSEKAVDLTADQVKLQLPGDFKFQCTISIRHSDIDINQHINSAAYFDYLDTALFRFFKKTKIQKEVTMQFKKEIPPETEEIVVNLVPNQLDNAYYFKISSHQIAHAIGYCKISDQS
ncbi:MAG: thioesterase [Spirochaetes bacterium]|nr:thioesterase [Spirochaetota bacterium]